jgi:uncharacterized surface protein with fasciclin (FAS1) repeats
MGQRRGYTKAAICALLLCLAALPAPAADLVETAQDTRRSGQFRIDHFVIALEVAGLVDSLKEGSYTVFAPTNQVFRRLDLGVLKPGGPAMSPEEKLRAVDKDRLADLLKDHVVEGRIPYTELVRKEALTTLGGTTLEVKPTEGGVLINGITVAKPDLLADNGVIHVVEGLLVSGGGRQQ